MKNCLPKLLFALLLLLCQQLSANKIIVKGHIKDTHGTPRTYWPVSILIDSTLTPNCIQHHYSYTDANGYYYDTLTCDYAIKQVFIITYDCNYIQLVRKEKPSSKNIIESNFTICSPPPVCNAEFYITKDSLNPKSIYAYSGSNASGNDSVIQRVWYWGDGDSTSTNSATAAHAYKNDGLYTVCMRIKTAMGCTSYACDSAEIVSKCKAAFNYIPLPSTSAGYGIRMFSGISSAPPGDSIIKRIWLWGDGSKTENKDSINAAHYYKIPSAYNVTLIIKTKNGCIDTSMLNISIPVNGLQCNASFSFINDSNKVSFDSHESNAGLYASDSIISRKWSFGDSTYQSGNIINTSHTYKDTGSYYTCLTIKTLYGCESTACNVVSIKNSVPVHCNASFTDTVLQQNLNGYAVSFNSSRSNTGTQDSITERIWHFGDGTVEDGNHIDPAHYYAQPGQYNVCLIIRSLGGCFDSTCSYITIQPSQINCRAGFSFVANGDTVQFKSADSSYAAAGDSIISRYWNFGDSTMLQENIINPAHTYVHTGTYYVCLTIKTVKGCESTTCGQVTVAQPQMNCKASFVYDTVSTGTNAYTVTFNSSSSETSYGDSIIKRTWNYGDGITEEGNHIDPSHAYQTSGVKTTCLFIQTKNGCFDSTCTAINIASQEIKCNASFSYNKRNDSVWFSSADSSYAAAGDTIISRYWNFGDSSAVLGGNISNPLHRYTQPGTYHVCLTVKTAKGCESTICNEVENSIISTVTCEAFFTYEKLAPMKYSFNSNVSYTSAGDNIIKRYWNFGDSTSMQGNTVMPVKEYMADGTYKICLTIQTAKGCIKRACTEITVKDSVADNNDWVKIVKLFPNPVPEKFKTTLWSKVSNVKCELSILDAYGHNKFNKSITLQQGNNNIEMPTINLNTGTYYLKATTIYGIKSKLFFKL